MITINITKTIIFFIFISFLFINKITTATIIRLVTITTIKIT